MLTFALATVLATTVVAGAGAPAHADSDPPATDGPAVVSVGPIVSDEGVPMSPSTFADGSYTPAAAPRHVEGPFATAAAAGCGSACDWTDPNHLFKPDPHNSRTWYKCANDAETVFAYWSGPGDLQIELRYSAHCRSAWARGWAYHNFMVENFRNGESYRRALYQHPRDSPDTRTWSPMLNDKGFVARACVLRANLVDTLWCTSKY